MAYVSLSKMPSPKKEYIVSFENLSGGLNLQELDYRIGNNETPEMKNLLWREGVLSCRDGQVYINGDEGSDLHKAFNALWNGAMIIHAGTKLFSVDPEDGEYTAIYTGSTDFKYRGAFFLYGEKLYYKTRGYYIEISYNQGTSTFSAANVVGYTPVTYINCSPDNGSGTVYQPENRISSKKELWYNSGYTLTNTVSGNLFVSIEDSYFRFQINTPGTYVFTYNGSNWVFNGDVVDPLDYGIRVGGTPVTDNTITVTLAFKNHYYLPIQDVDVTKVVVDGEELAPESYTLGKFRALFVPSIDLGVWRTMITESGFYKFQYSADNDEWTFDNTVVDIADYGLSYTCPSALTNSDYITVDYTSGYWVDEDEWFVGFDAAPTCYYPEINNTVHITYSKENSVAEANIMDCEYVTVYGGTGSLCVVMAGSKTQPNAYFWNGQNSVAMDPTYFPMTQYQLAGDGVDPITGFGKQQGYLIIFKNGSVGRTSLSTETVEGRLTIDLPYTAINAKIGCDLPYTIQLVENNLVWCNTNNGVHFLANTSAAYENNIECISLKVNESSQAWSKGLLYDVRQGNIATSHDDEKRYWLIVGGHVWLWDYSISNYKNPAWFYFDNIHGVDFIQEHDDIWHFDSNSRLTKFVRAYYDYDPVNESGAIDKVFRFASQYFGTYDNLKTVNSVIINMRSDTNSLVSLEYITDYEVREDLTPLQSLAWMLVPRNLSFRILRGSGFSHVFRRKPHCRRVHYFTMRLRNRIPTMDMFVVSAQIYYTYQGRFR